MIECNKYLVSVSHNGLAIHLKERDVMIRLSHVLPGFVFVNLSSTSVTRRTRKVEGFGGAFSLVTSGIAACRISWYHGPYIYV
jgi:hypothetical protein